MPTLTKVAGEHVNVTTARYTNTGGKDIAKFRVGYALYGPASRGGLVYDMGALPKGSYVDVPSAGHDAVDTTGLPAGNYTLRMSFYDGAVSTSPFGQYDVTDWIITIQVAAATGVTPSNIGLAALIAQGPIRKRVRELLVPA